MKTKISFSILSVIVVLWTSSIQAQTQLNIQGMSDSPDTVVIKANYQDQGLILINSVIGLCVESKYEISAGGIFDGIAGYFDGGSRGILARSQNGIGISGVSDYGTGVRGLSVYGNGVYGETQSINSYAGYFQGNVKINGEGKSLTFPDGSRQTTAYSGENLFYSTTSPEVQEFEDLIPPNTSRAVSCECNEGDKITGGGWEAWRNGTNRTHDRASNAYYNRPVWTIVNGKRTGGWKVGFRNNTDYFYRILVYCLCVDVN